MTDQHHPPPAAGAASHIRSLRSRPSSVPLPYELYASTSDPIVLAFHASARFHDPDRNPPLTLDGLRQRWDVGRPRATLARRELISLSYWAEVRSCDPRGRFTTETRTWDFPITEADLRDLAIEYLPGTKITCGGQIFRVTGTGELDYAGNTDPQLSNTRPHQRKRSRSSEPQIPAVRQMPAPEAQKPRSRPHQPTLTPEPHLSDTRPDQVQHPIRPDHTERQKGETHASSVLRTDDDHACMDELSVFWKTITQTIGSVDGPGRRTVQPQIHTALAGGWTPQALADWVLSAVVSARKRQQLSNPAGFVITRLRDIPIATVASERPSEVGLKYLPICGECDAREHDGGIHTRMLETEDGRVIRCPRCHPFAARVK